MRRTFASFRPHHTHSILVWVLLFLLLLALLILVVGAMLVAGRPRRRTAVEEPLFRPMPPSSAEQILAERLASGEIDADEYRRRRNLLRE